MTWDGFFNARDLGGLPTRDGRRTRHGAFIRSADLRFVTEAGWKAAWLAGVRSVIDLRNPDEIRPQRDGPGPTALAGSAQFVAPMADSRAPQQLQRIELPLDDIGDTAFWREMNDKGLNGLPHYYGPFLARKRERCAAVVTAMADAAPGGVLFHCGAGRDRTGLVAMLLLGLAGVEPSAIVSDYQLTAQGLPPLLAALGLPDSSTLSGDAPALSTAVEAELRAVLREYDMESYLRGAGVAVDDISTIRARLLGP